MSQSLQDKIQILERKVKKLKNQLCCSVSEVFSCASLALCNTDNLSEGLVNKYFTGIITDNTLIGNGKTIPLSVVGGVGGGTGTSQIPSGFSSKMVSETINNAVFTDVANTTISVTIPASAYIYANVAWQSSETGGGSAAIGEARLVIGTENSDSVLIDVAAKANANGGVDLRSTTPLPAGTYTIKMQARRVSGTKNFNIDKAKIFGEGLIASGNVVTASYSQALIASTSTTITLPATQTSTNYKIFTTPLNSNSAVLFYISNKTTTTFNVNFPVIFTGTFNIDYIIAS